MLSTGLSTQKGEFGSAFALARRSGYGSGMTRAIPHKTAFLATLLCLSLGACGSMQGYPSLARRPAERITGTAEAVAAAPAPVETAAAAPDLGLQSRLARMLEAARSAHGRFGAARGKAERLASAARGAAVASDAWSAASIAISQLESERGAAMIALADADALYSKVRVDGGDSQAITAVRDQIAAWVADEDAALAGLWSRLRK